MSVPFTVIVPARFGSSRFPGKPLARLGGKPMLLHTCDCARASGASTVAVATDDARIAAVAEDAGLQCLMTSPDHQSGTDRLAEAAVMLGLDDDEIVVNLQGDEPLMPPAHVRLTADLLGLHPAADVSTLVLPLDTAVELHDPNAVKAVVDGNGYALYFSRAPIPWDRDFGGRPPADRRGWLRHLGIYGYRVGFLKRYPSLSTPAIERTESLEQLRVLWHGYRIITATVEQGAGPGVDTPDDLQRVEALLRDSG
ncbi:MAG: 3-deoxy-manno-octulosonate cytidylyltransferase [Ectothiorhodospiraceae bacterium]|nr:3-deoxy-manno-octulosonate cytidylyltransferase [Paracoccaceae bacterium]MCH8503729.1 3-deoxy-manno-octulosonate cytidylyltransferase [Ectothiorhodospiraceae bacterium]